MSHGSETQPLGCRSTRPALLPEALDFTKIALAVLTAAGFVFASWRGMSKSKPFFKR
jgi:hypothetical protein